MVDENEAAGAADAAFVAYSGCMGRISSLTAALHRKVPTH